MQTVVGSKPTDEEGDEEKEAKEEDKEATKANE
jgi:hypothetical protein